jgi:hypothetical protein
MLNRVPSKEAEDRSRRVLAKFQMGPGATAADIDGAANNPTRKVGMPRAATSFLDREDWEVDWSQLPPCPVQGFELRDNGLVDLEEKRPLTVNEMRMLINEMSAIEARALYSAESRFASTAIGRLSEHTITAGPLGMLGFAAFFAFRKFPHAYDSAYPQNSLYIKWYARKHMSPRELEQLCMRNRTSLNLTNSRPVLFAFLSTFLTVSAAYFSSARGTDGVIDQDTREAMAYFRHLEGSLKWTWTVYHCHPAYKKSKTVPRRPGEQGADQVGFVPMPTFAGKRKVLGERDRSEMT